MDVGKDQAGLRAYIELNTERLPIFCKQWLNAGVVLFDEYADDYRYGGSVRLVIIYALTSRHLSFCAMECREL